MAHEASHRHPDTAMIAVELREFLHRSGAPPPTADDVARYVVDLFTPETAPIELASGTDSGPSIRIDIEESRPAPLASPKPAAEPVDVFTTARPRPQASVGLFDGWSARRRAPTGPIADDDEQPRRWPWSR